MSPDLTDLSLFVEIAEAPSLTQGAARAHRSPASASARLAKLEARLGARLFERSHQGMTLTPAGRRLLQHARAVLARMDRLVDAIAADDDAEAGHLRVLANTTAVSELLPGLLADFLGVRPRLTIDLREQLNHDVVRGVLEGRADLGIVAGPIDTSGLERWHFSTDRLVLVTARTHPLADRGRIGFTDLLTLDHVGLHDTSSLMRFLVERFRIAGAVMNLRIQVSNFEAVCRLVATGVGVGVMPESAARRHAAHIDLAIVALDAPWAERERSVVVRDTTALSGAGLALLEQIIASGDGPSKTGPA